jgi:hypothetical protein
MASPGFPDYTPLEFYGAPSYIPVGKSTQNYTPDFEPLKDTMGAATFANKYPLANLIIFGKPKKPTKKPSNALKEKQARLAVFNPYGPKYTDEQLLDESLAFYEKRRSKK